MPCLDMGLESRYAAAMSGVSQYRVDGNQLVLLANGRVLARFDPSTAR